MDLRHATPADVAAWEADWRERLPEGYRQRVERRREKPADSRFEFALHTGGEHVGLLAMSDVPGQQPVQMLLDDIVIDPAHRRKGHARAALAAAVEHARSRGAALVRVNLQPEDAAQAALVEGLVVTSQHMNLELAGAKPLPEGVTAERLTGADFDAWRAESVQGYAELNAENGLGTLEELLPEAEKEFAALLPQGADTEGHHLHKLVAGGEWVATIWVKAFYEPGTHFIFDVVADPAHRGKGYGRAAMLHGENLAVADGATHLKLNVHGTNTLAIGLYERLGYRTVYQFRAIEL
ncbi:GNAT family N-acetyltransferase [Actinorhabdospora filicis]|nr:GNAT family N-acetyltransferase [Actinorhabdospora filicis]